MDWSYSEWFHGSDELAEVVLKRTHALWGRAPLSSAVAAVIDVVRVCLASRSGKAYVRVTCWGGDG